MPDLMRLRLPRESLTSPVERQDHRGIGAFGSTWGARSRHSPRSLEVSLPPSRPFSRSTSEAAVSAIETAGKPT